MEQLELNCCCMVNAIRSILPYLVLFVASAPECLSLHEKDIPRGEMSMYNKYILLLTIHYLF